MTTAGDDKTDQASGVKSEPFAAGKPIPAPPRSADISPGRGMMFIALLGFALFSPWSIAGAQMCLGLGLLSWAVSLFLPSRRRVILSSLIWPVAVYLGIQFLSVLFSPDLLTGLHAVRAEWIVLLFFLVVNAVDDDRQIRQLASVLVLTTVLVSLYAIWQHWSGWDLYRQRPLRAAGNFFEATGLFGHHLTYGGYLMMVAMLSVSLALFGIRGRTRLLYALSSLVLFLALLFSYARSAWIGFLAGALGMAVLRGRRTMAVVLPVVAVVIIVAALFLPAVQEQAEEAVSQLQGRVKSDRLLMWAAAWQLIGDRPLLGAGPGQAGDALSRYGYEMSYGHLHNDLINTAANSGLIGLAAFLWIWAAFLYLTARCRRRFRKTPWTAAMATAGFGIVIALLAAGQFQCYYTDAEDGMLLWLLLGLTAAGCRKQRHVTTAPVAESAPPLEAAGEGKA